MSKGGRSPFTLIEMLVIACVIVILISLLLPAMSNALDSALRKQCLMNQRQIYNSAQFYADDFNDHLPGNGQYAGHPSTIRNQGNILYFIWAYLDIPLHKLGSTDSMDDPVDFITSGVLVGSFADPGGRGIMECPSSASSELADNVVVNTIDYFITGFGPSGWASAYTKVYDYPSLTKLGESLDGKLKTFSIDNLFLTPLSDHRAHLFTHLNNHDPGNPKGANTIYGDGSGAWLDITEVQTSYYPLSDGSVSNPGAENRAVPMNAYSQVTGWGNVGSGALGSLKVTKPGGGFSWDMTNRTYFYK